jgi:lysophospholipase L1-like esterase
LRSSGQTSGAVVAESPLVAEAPSSAEAPSVAEGAPAPASEPTVDVVARGRSTPTRVLVLGDSLSDEQVGGGGFVRFLRQRCAGVPFDNRAKGGFMVNQMRKRLETEVLPEGNRYSDAIVFGGVNDLYSDLSAHRTLPRIQADLSRIYADLKQRGVRVIAVTVTPWGGFKRWFSADRSQHTLSLNGWILELAQQGTIETAVDAYPLLSCGDPERLCPELAAPLKDGLHFGKLGQEKLGQALYEAAFQGCKAAPR